jgi:pimeloyl-ACP methyl ester carboxylesterase
MRVPDVDPGATMATSARESSAAMSGNLNLTRRSVMMGGAVMLASGLPAFAADPPAEQGLEEYSLDTPQASIRAYAWVTGSGQDQPLIVGLHGGGFNGRYYNAPGYSLVDAAVKRRFGVVLLDRPGYGKSQASQFAGDILDMNASNINDAIGQIWRKSGQSRPGVVLLGHSIGGGIALKIAALPNDWPLLGVTVSGIGDVRPAGGGVIPLGQPGATPTGPPPPNAMFETFFAPGASSPAALSAMALASDLSPVVGQEIASIYSAWIQAFNSTTAAIKVPVQLRMSEYERLWETGDAVVARMRRKFSGSPRADVELTRGVGHTIEYHPQGSAYIGEVLDFAQSCARR